MDTLVIVRKIREAESLADSGNHGDARRMLEPLLAENGLSETHRKLVAKKIDLFKKQQERMTRIISRRATTISTREDHAASNESSERTAIRPAIDPDKSERPTDLTIEKEARGQATEVVPRARNVDTEIPEKGHKLKVESRSGQSSGMWSAISDRREVVRPPAASDSQELAPVSAVDSIDSADETSDDDPRKTDIFVAPPPEPKVSDSHIQVAPEDDSAPSIGRYNVDSPVYPVGNDTPAPTWNDTPVPQAVTPPRSPVASPPSVRVRDSFVIPPAQAAAATEDHDDSTFLMAEDYFTSRASARQRERSNPELKALADRLPDDDLRRELALEVVKLREELEKSKSGRRESTRSGSRKLQREDRPESGSFHIPASQVNTIVRRAAGTDRIEVHMPGRDDNATELQVLRRDSVRGEKVATPTDRIALAQDYIDAAQVEKPSLLKPAATWLGVAAVVAVLAWAVHLGYRSLLGATPVTVAVSDESVGDFRLGATLDNYPGLVRGLTVPQARSPATGWIIQHDDAGHITGVTIPGPGHSALAARQYRGLEARFGTGSLDIASEGAGRDVVLRAFGEATPPYSDASWTQAETYTLRFVSRQGERALEFHYDTRQPERPLWIRLLDARANPPEIKLDDYPPQD